MANNNFTSGNTSTQQLLDLIRTNKLRRGRGLSARKLTALAKGLSQAETDRTFRGLLATEQLNLNKATLAAQEKATADRLALEREKMESGEDAAAVQGVLNVAQLGVGAEFVANQGGSTIFGQGGMLDIKGGINYVKDFVGLGTLSPAASSLAPAAAPFAVAETAPAVTTALGSVGAETSGQVASQAFTQAETQGAIGAAPQLTSPIIEQGVGNVAGDVAADAVVAGADKATGFSAVDGATSIKAGVAGFAANYVARKFGANQELGNAVGGAVSGWIIGAKMGGTALGPVGAAIGAVIGFVIGEIFDEISVICTELFKQGLLPEEIYRLDSEFGRTKIDDITYLGYRDFADPIVKRMQKSPGFAKLVAIFAMPWCKQAAHVMRPDLYKNNLIGKFIMLAGIPYCYFRGVKVFKKAIRRLTWVNSSVR